MSEKDPRAKMEETMVKMMETIRRRRSVRTFDGNVLRDEDRKKILEFAEKVENPYDLPITWKILEAKNTV